MKYYDWDNPPKKVKLLQNEIHIWRANLDLPSVVIEKLASTLSKDEINRANRFRFQQHRDRFIVGRGILRKLLANYLQVKSDLAEGEALGAPRLRSSTRRGSGSPEARLRRPLRDRVIFEYSPRGKPQLASSLNQDSLQFNVSHSQDLAIYGFNYQRIIGVDLEYIKDNIDYKQLAKRFFTTQELQLIHSYPTSEQKTIFFQLWTAKEAYLKATGEGLAGSLDTIEFTLDNNSVKLMEIKQDQAQVSYWSINNFIPQDNFIATIAVKNNSIISDSIATKFFEYR